MENNTIVNHDWLHVIADHPDTTTEDLLAAYAALGVAPDTTEEQLDESTFRLQLFGFLRVVDVSADGRTYTYAPSIPGAGA